MTETWYAARVITGKEYEVREKIKKSYEDYNVYIPRRLVTEYKHGKLVQKTEKILPGYLLIGTSRPLSAFLKADFLKVIGKVTPREIEALKMQEIQEEGKIQEGQKVIVNNGPFAGIKGVILSKEQGLDTARCRFVFQGRELEIDMRLDYLNSI